MNSKKATQILSELCEKIQNKTLKNLVELMLFVNVYCWTTHDFIDYEGEYPSIERIQRFLNCSNRKAQDFAHTMEAIEILQDTSLSILAPEEDKKIKEMLEQKLH